MIEALKDLLKSDYVTVKFTKKDGTVRTMNCTLKDGVAPWVEGKKKKKENDQVMSVWDLDKNAWRSFRVENIIEYSVSV